MTSFAGLRVLSLESRRAVEIGRLIASQGGIATVAPSMREIPLESNTQAIEFAAKLFRGEFDVVILLTGVGTRVLARAIETVYPLDQFVGALRTLPVVVRGPKPLAVLREWGVPAALAVPEPNTWRDLLRALDEKADLVALRGRRIALQEYGISNAELLAGLSERGAIVTSVPVYEWGLPEDVAPLRAAVESIAGGRMDVILFTTAMQVNHLLQVAAEMDREPAVRKALSRMVIASIGPITSERLHDYGLLQDLEPSHPKMGYLVSETAQRSAEILQRKRA